MIQNLQQRIRTKLNLYRNIDRLINTFDFAYIYESLSQNDRDTLNILLENGNKDEALIFLSSKEEKVIEDLNIRKLREIAGQLCIEYYTHLSKVDLIGLILKVKANARVSITSQNSSR